jgi:hypothetical protein
MLFNIGFKSALRVAKSVAETKSMQLSIHDIVIAVNDTTAKVNDLNVAVNVKPLVAPVLTNEWDVIVKDFEDEPFDIVPPETNSQGTFTYTSTHPDVASVDANGRVTIKHGGTTTIHAHQAAHGEHSAGEFKTMMYVTRDPIIEPWVLPEKTIGDPNFKIVAPQSNSKGEFTYTESTNPAVATITNDGIVTILGPGVTTLIAQQEPADDFGQAEVSGELRVTKAKTTSGAAAETSGNEKVGVGIGFKRSPQTGYFQIGSFAQGSPAEQSFIKKEMAVGDVLTEVDHKPVHGMDGTAVTQLILGPIGSQVKLTLKKPDGKSMEVTLIRAKAKEESVAPIVAPFVPAKQSQTLIQYITSHKAEFENVRAQMLIGTKTDAEIVSFVVARLGCDQLIKTNPVGNPCNNPKASHMYADLVNLIATGPFNETKIKDLIIKLCEGDSVNWDSFYHIFKAMGLHQLERERRDKIFNKFVDLFGGYLVLGAHFTTTMAKNISIEWFDNIGTLQNDSVPRTDAVHWTKLDHPRWKWFGYSERGDQLNHDKLTRWRKCHCQ